MSDSRVTSRRRRAQMPLRRLALPTASLFGLARQHLRIAGHSLARSSTQDLCGSPSSGLRQLLVAAKAGELFPGDWSTADRWTVQVLVGQVRVRGSRPFWAGWPGDLLVMRNDDPQLEAVTDAVVVVSTAHIRSPPSEEEP